MEKAFLSQSHGIASDVSVIFAKEFLTTLAGSRNSRPRRWYPPKPQRSSGQRQPPTPSPKASLKGTSRYPANGAAWTSKRSANRSNAFRQWAMSALALAFILINPAIRRGNGYQRSRSRRNGQVASGATFAPRRPGSCRPALPRLRPRRFGLS